VPVQPALVQVLGEDGPACPATSCCRPSPGYGQGLRRAGPYGGYLGSRYNPLFGACEVRLPRAQTSDYDPTLVPSGDPQPPASGPGLTADALDGRRTLLEQIDAQAALAESSRGAVLMAARQRKVFELLQRRRPGGRLTSRRERREGPPRPEPARHPARRQHESPRQAAPAHRGPCTRPRCTRRRTLAVAFSCLLVRQEEPSRLKALAAGSVSEAGSPWVIVVGKRVTSLIGLPLGVFD
jgi:hypothetical protein